MPGLFSTEGKFYGALSLAADLVIVNVMMLVAMLPVVTGGAALRAATVVITQLLNNEAGTPVRTFLREFTRKWKASTVWWFITTALMLFAVYEFYVIFRADVGNTTRLLLCASVLSGVCVLAAVSVWFYPLAHMGGVRSTFFSKSPNQPPNQPLIDAVPPECVLPSPRYVHKVCQKLATL